MQKFYIYFICMIFNLQQLYAAGTIIVHKTSTINPFNGASQSVPPLDKTEDKTEDSMENDLNVDPVMTESLSQESLLKEVLATPDSSDIENEKAVEEDGNITTENILEKKGFTLTNEEINPEPKNDDDPEEDNNLQEEENDTTIEEN